jgi:hypothetical protein
MIGPERFPIIIHNIISIVGVQGPVMVFGFLPFLSGKRWFPRRQLHFSLGKGQRDELV